METRRFQFTIGRMLGAMAILGLAFAALGWGFRNVEGNVAQPIVALMFAIPLIVVSALYLWGQPLIHASTAVVLWSALALMVLTIATFLLFFVALIIAIAASA